MNKKKIGIMSMQRIKNYGSFLQAYALKRTIEKLGHNVEFVDYHVEKPLIEGEKSTKLQKIKEVFAGDAKLLHKLQYILHKKHFSGYQKGLNLTEEPNYNPKLDTLVIGSDEVFNLIQSNNNVGYSLELLGKDSRSKKTISYAASFGNTTLEKIQKYNKVEDFKKYLKRLDTISVRDENSRKIVKKLTGKEPRVNLDPVLIYDFKSDKTFSFDRKTSDKYMILYAYNDRISKDEAKKIKEFAKKNNLKLYSIGGAQPYADKFIDCRPYDIFAWFKNAEFVVTDTFHGSIFSIVTNRPFVTIVRKSKGVGYGNEEKLTYLLEKLGQKGRLIDNIDSLENVLREEMDYGKTNQIIKEEQEKTIDYLAEKISFCDTKNQKVSIVIPVYNVEKYLPKCIESIINQTYRNLEIILVDDGSMDASGSICDEYATKDTRIRVVHKKNAGVSAARNTGIDVATGEYLCFVDGDDLAMPDYVEYMLSLFVEDAIEITLTTAMFDNFSSKNNKKEIVETVSGEDACEKILCYKIPIGVYCKMFKLSFIKDKNVRFLEGVFMGEGFNFNVMSFQRAKKVAISNKKIYFYRRDNSTSATTKFSLNKCENSLYALDVMRSNLIANTKKIDKAWRYAKWRTYSDAFDYMVLGGAANQNKEKYKEYRRYIKEYSRDTKDVPISKKDRMRSRVMSVFPELIPLALKARRIKYGVKIDNQDNYCKDKE